MFNLISPSVIFIFSSSPEKFLINMSSLSAKKLNFDSVKIKSLKISTLKFFTSPFKI